MSGAKVSLVAAQLQTNAAAIATAAGGGLATTDIQALAAVLQAACTSLEAMVPFISMGTTPANASTMLTPG